MSKETTESLKKKFGKMDKGQLEAERQAQVARLTEDGAVAAEKLDIIVELLAK